MSAAALAERDRRVFADAAARRLPVAVVMAGGYGRDVEDTVAVHAATIAAAARAWRERR